MNIALHLRLTSCEQNLETPLTLLIRSGSIPELATVKAMIDLGADCTIVNAVSTVQVELTSKMLILRACLFQRKENALIHACCLHLDEVAKYLVERGAPVNEISTVSPLRIDVFCGLILSVSLQSGETALCYACLHGMKEIAMLLLANGAEDIGEVVIQTKEYLCF
jgi:ankyrin repeat protein